MFTKVFKPLNLHAEKHLFMSRMHVTCHFYFFSLLFACRLYRVLWARLSFACGASFWAECVCSSHEQDKPEGQSFRRADFERQTRLRTGCTFVFVPLHKRLCWGVQNRLYWRTCLWGLSCACSWSWLEASQPFILRLQNCAGVAGDRLCFAVGLASLLSCVPHRWGHAASLGGPAYSCAGCTGRVSACMSPHTYPEPANSCGRSVWMTSCRENTWTMKSPTARCLSDGTVLSCSLQAGLQLVPVCFPAPFLGWGRQKRAVHLICYHILQWCDVLPAPRVERMVGT